MQVGKTGEGYVYLRDRAGGDDVTVYLHQLNALLAGHSVAEVFDPATEVHHRVPHKELNIPENLTVLSADRLRTGLARTSPG